MTDIGIFKSNPLLKLAVPLMAGIAIGWHCGMELPWLCSLLSMSFVAMLLGLSKRFPTWLFGAGALSFMFSVGLFIENVQRQHMQASWCASELRYEARLLEVPDVQGRYVKVLADVVLSDTSILARTRSNGLAMLYFQRTVDTDSLAVGDRVVFNAIMRNPENAGNPAEFDFEHYCHVNGITGAAYLKDGCWKHNGNGGLSVYMRAMLLRERVLAIYRDSGFEDDGLSLLSALTVGEKRGFPRELKEKYSAAGASHVLALSGLHLGILYMLLMLLSPRVHDVRLSLLKESLVVVSLWTFAFVAGLSPSVTRSAILFTFMSVGRLLERDNSSVNSLAFAAIAMLIVEPHLLFDISFQLSFAAVFSILCIVPPMQRRLNVDSHGVVYRYVVNLLLISLAAQIGTLPFVWYCFGMFPFYFLFTNLFVVPLAFVIVALAVVVCVVQFIPVVQSAAVWLLSLVLDAMNGFVGFVSSLPGAAYALPPLTLSAAFCVALLLVLFVAAVVQHKRWLLFLVSLNVAILALVYSLLPGAELPNDYIVIYNNRRNPLVHVVAKDKTNALVSTVPLADAEYEYSSGPYIRREGLPVPSWMCGNDTLPGAELHDGVLSFAGLKVCLLDNALWNDNLYIEPVDVLLLCRGFLGDIKNLIEVYPTNCIVLDASLYRHSRNRIMRECAALGMEAIDVSGMGALKIVPSDESFEIHAMRGK